MLTVDLKYGLYNQIPCTRFSGIGSASLKANTVTDLVIISAEAFVMSYSPIGDTIALTKLAYALYSKVIVVARDAPEQFEALLQDLDIYKKVLYRIQSQTDHDNDPSHGVAVQDVLNRCFHTLYGLRDLTTKYENLGQCGPSAS